MAAFEGLAGIDVVGPIRGEIFAVWLDGGQITITGPDGPRAWIIQIEDAEHPVEAVDRIVRGLLGPALLVHSTSWRREGSAIVLSFVVVIRPDQAAGMDSRPVLRSKLARSGATRAPEVIGSSQVLEHGLRHLSWLAQDDPVVSERLSQEWKDALASYVPQPFRGFE